MGSHTENLAWNGRPLADFRDEEVIFFIRIRGKKSYFANVYTEAFLANFEGVTTYRTISEYPFDADVHIDLNAQSDNISEAKWSKYSSLFDLAEMIERCRGLRFIAFQSALDLVFRAIQFFETFFTQHPDLKLIVMGTVDNYVMDIMERMAKLHQVDCIAVTDSFMSPTYKLISVRGEHNAFRTVSEAEVTAAVVFTRSKLEARRSKTFRKMVGFALYCFASYYYRYVMRYWVRHRLLGRLEYEYIFAPKLAHFHSLSQAVAACRLPRTPSPIESRGSDARPLAYVPLHYVPEATIDYWVASTYHCNYERSLFDVCSRLQALGYDVVAKEHPAYQFGRTAAFYRKLTALGVMCLSGEVSTQDIFDHVDLVVVWNGSTGIEGLLAGKRVVRVVNSYYGDAIPSFETASKEDTGEAAVSADVVMRKVLETSFKTIL